MCFAKSSPVVVEKPQDPVVQHEADASLTKNSHRNNTGTNFKENIKTTPLGLDDQAKTAKKTLLGE